MRQRRTFNDTASKRVREAFEKAFSYNSTTGEITNIRKQRQYQKLQKKGYKASLYLTINKVEYRVTYHRLCWFLYYRELLPDDVQIDHRNLVKSDNRILNLRKCTNAQNACTKALRKDNTTGYKGVMIVCNTTKYYTYGYYTAVIKNTKIARFDNPFHAAIFYDSACRFYDGNFAVPNFSYLYLLPMSVEDLRKYKRTKVPLPEMAVKTTG